MAPPLPNQRYDDPAIIATTPPGEGVTIIVTTQRRAPGKSTTQTTVVLALVVLVGVACRTVVAARGWFYWDDLILHARARQFDSPAPELLFSDHDGHLMPGSWLIEWLLASIAPLSWPAAVVTLAVLQLATAAAVAWACLVVCPRVLELRLRNTSVSLPWAVLPLAAYLLTPLTLPTTTWLATAVNILPLHMAFALLLGQAMLALRTRQLRHQFYAAGWLVVGLLFSERALFLGPTVIITMLCFSAATKTAGRHGRSIGQLAVVLALPTIIWSVIYLVVIGDPRNTQLAATTLTEAGEQNGGIATLFSNGYLLGLLPTLGGGPWNWERWHPGPPWASPGALAITAGVLVLLALAAWTARRGARTLVVWLPALLYPLAGLSALALARTSPDTAAEIAQTLRHFSEVAVLGAVTFAVVGGLSTSVPAPRPVRLLTPVALVAVLLSAAVSTVTYAQVWSEQPARSYFGNLRDDLGQRSEPIFDQAVGLDVLLPVVRPHNQLSWLIDGLPGVPPIEPWTTDPAYLDDAGNLRPAELAPLRSTVPGTDPECGLRVAAAGSDIEIAGPLMDRDWMVLLNYFADADGTVMVQLDEEPVEIPVTAGLGQVYVQVSGGGPALRVAPATGVDELCVGTSDIGVLAPAD